MRRIALPLVLVVTLATAVACSTALATPRTPLPPANAHPSDVVAAYLEALVDGDCAKARALSANTGLAVQAPFCDRPRVIGFSVLSCNGACPNGTEAVYVVELTTRGGDVSLPDGEHTMFVQVLLQPGGVWRVNGIGSGP